MSWEATNGTPASWSCVSCSRIVCFVCLCACLLTVDTVLGQGSYYRSRRRHGNRQSRASRAPGPNMCRVQHVLGSKEKYFTSCVAQHVKLICERPTYVRWECCPGFAKKGREQGCTGERPLGNLMDTAEELGLEKFHRMASGTTVGYDLETYGAYTVFAPTDEAILEASPSLVSRLSEGGNHSLLMYHVAPGRLNISTFRAKNQQFVTLLDNKPVRVNKYAYGVATVNCARIIRPDELATNGILHVIDKVINPNDLSRSLAKLIYSDDQFSQFQLALFVSDMAKRLRKKGSFTVLAPTNKAFAKLPNDLLDRILSDADTAEKVVKQHIVRGVYCADAIVVSVGLKTLGDKRLLFRCKREGMMVNQARVSLPDLVASNGVVHGIDTVLLPDEVKNAAQLLYEMHLDKFLDMARKAGLNSTLSGDENITIFAPTNEAFKGKKKYLAALMKEPLKMKQLISYHIVKGLLTNDAIVGNMALTTKADVGAKIKLNVFRKGVTVDKASLQPHPRNCRNAILHRVDHVLIPSVETVQDMLVKDPQMSKFYEMLELSGMSETLDTYGSYTVLAPTNWALGQLDQRLLEKLMDDPFRLRKFVRRHIIARMVLRCTVPTDSIYNINSLQGDKTEFELDSRDRLLLNDHSKALSEDLLASNGILYKIDHVLPCSCERSMRNRYGQYINSYRYRRRP